MTFAELAELRCSTKRFSDRELEEEKLQRLLKTALLAPTAKNNQPFHIYVLKSPEALAKVDQVTPCRYGAGTVLVFVYDDRQEWNNPMQAGIHSGVEDASIVAAHVMLQAADIGVDSCWVNAFPNDRLHALLALDEHQHIVLLMDLGYRADDWKPTLMHTASKTEEEVVTRL